MTRNFTGCFVSGTDTGVGKTMAAVTLIRYLAERNLKVVGMKPVAAGCESHNGVWVNEDALKLQQASNINTDYRLINPFAYPDAVSPHIAGKKQPLNLDTVKQAFEELGNSADCVIVEGAGGWLSPLSENLNNADLARALNLPVCLVVGLRLGCLNHACLSAQAIAQSGLSCAGWLAVSIDPKMQVMEENIDYLKSKFDFPLWGVLPYREDGLFDESFTGLITIK